MKRGFLVFFLLMVFITKGICEENITSLFKWVQLIDVGGPKEVYKKILWELSRSTSVESETEPFFGSLKDERIFLYPFICISGFREFPPLSLEERQRIFSHLSAGGLWLIDDVSGRDDSPFMLSAKREFERVFGKGKIKEIPSDHVIFRTFFLFKPEVAEEFGLYGIEIDERTGVIFSKGLLSAIEKEDVKSIRLMINIIMFALTTDYKTDQIHQPFIRRRLR